MFLPTHRVGSHAMQRLATALVANALFDGTVTSHQANGDEPQQNPMDTNDSNLLSCKYSCRSLTHPGD